MQKYSEIQKIVVLACPAGRAGSSAVMGVLDLAGFCAGNEGRVVKGGGMNPKGFFELRAQEKLLGRVFRGYYPGPTAPPDLDLVAENCKHSMNEFKKLLRREFQNQGQIAIKAPRWLPLPFYEHLSKEFDVRVLSLTRNLEKQVRSTYRVWRQTYDPILASADQEQIRNWLLTWQGFADQMRNQCAVTLPIYDLSFEQLMAAPVVQSKMLMRWLDEPSPDEDVLRSWFEASLVNRNSLPPITRIEAAKRGLKRRLLNIIQKPIMHYSPHIVR